MITRQQLIMEEALKLFAKKGFESTSIQEITDACGISKGAFYLSFKSKDELISSMVDFFMRKLIIDVDRSVKHSSDDVVLYAFYTTIFSAFHKHTDFAKFFIKEQMQSFDEDLFLKSQIYVQKMDKIILSMVERLYEETIKDTKHDLVFMINGLIKSYAQLFVLYDFPLELDALVKSLVEKTNILAKHTTMPFVISELPSLSLKQTDGKATKEQILEVVEQNISEMDASIEKESLVLLRDELLEPMLGRAVIKGLLANIQTHPQCKWAAYVLGEYFGE